MKLPCSKVASEAAGTLAAELEVCPRAQRVTLLLNQTERASACAVAQFPAATSAEIFKKTTEAWELYRNLASIRT